MVCAGRVFNGYLAQRPVLWVECRFPELLGVHLTQTLVALHVDAAVGLAVASELRNQAVALVVVPRVDGALALFDLVERRRGDVHVAVLNEVLHVAEEEGEDERFNVAAVHVGVTHDDNLVVAELRHVERALVFFGPDGHPEGRVDVLDFFVVEDLVLHGLLHVEDFSTEGHDGLEHAVAALLGRSACRVTLDQEELAHGGILLGAVGELAGEAASAHDRLALDHFAGLARRVACLGCEDDLLDNGLGVVWVLFEVSLEHVAHGLAHGGADLGVAELGLGLALELGFCNLHTHHGGQSFSEVVPADVKLQLVQHPAAVRVLLQRVGEASAETRQVCSTFVGVDVVDVGKEVLRKRVVVGHGDLHWHAAPLAAYVNHLLDDGLAVAVEIRHEVLQALGAVERLGDEVSFFVGVTLVRHRDGDALVEVREFAHAVGKRVVAVDQGFEDFVVRLEFHGGAALVGGADFAHRVLLLASCVFLLVDLAVAVNFRAEEGGKGVHARHTHTVQTARHLVGVFVKLTPCTNLGHDDLKGADAFLLVHVDGDATAVVRDANSVVLGDGHCDRVAVAGKCFVNGVVDDFVHQVVKSPNAHVADVHRRTHAHVFHALEGLDLTRVISRLPSFLVLF